MTPDFDASPTLGRGLGRRLLGWFLLLSLVPLGLSTALGYARSQGIIQALVHRYLEAVAQLQAHHIDDELQRHVLELRAVAVGFERGGSASPDTVDASTIDPYLLRQLAAFPEFGALYVFDASGTLLAAAPLSPEDLPFFLPYPLGEPTGPYEIVRDPTPPRAPHLRFALPLPSLGTDVYLGATVELVGGGDFLRIPEHIAGRIETFLVDSLGRPLFISHPHGHVDYGLALATPLLNGSDLSSARYRDRLGIDVVGTAVPFQRHGWRIVMEVPVESALAELRTLRSLSLGLVLFFTFGVIAAAWFVSKGIVAPARRLLKATHRVRDGDLDTRVDVNDTTEVGALARAFNQMTEELSRAAERVAEMHRREMERAGQLATVGELASGVAHEIKNPLAGIMAGLELVQRRLAGEPDVDRVVREMRRALERMETTTRDLLAFARPPEPALSRCDIDRVVERARTLVTPAADQAGVDIELQLAGDLPAVTADEEMIRQALVNLVMNGVQATDRGGLVRVSTAWDGTFVRVRVEDDGPGLTPEAAQEIFRPFFTTKSRGTGLGLPITQGIAERHGGRLEVEPGTGTGAAFILFLRRNGDDHETVRAESRWAQ